MKDNKDMITVKIHDEDERLPIVSDKSAAVNPHRKREIIKNILIVFLAVMLLLTFFSNTIMNRSLAEISTKAATEGKLTERVRGSGIVESNQVYEVKTDGNRIVDTICVKAGQTVEEGTVLFTVGGAESAELAEAQSMLAAMELEYEKALLSPEADYSAENQAIKNAREDLNTAIAKRDNAIANQGAEKAALDSYNANKASLSGKLSTQAKLQSALTAIDSDNPAGAAEYAGNLPTLYSAYTSAESAYNQAYELYSQLLSSGADASAAKSDADAKAAARDSALNAYNAEKSTVRADIAARLGAVEGEINTLNAAITGYESNASGGMSASIDELNIEVTAKQRALEDLIIALEKTQRADNAASQINSLDLEAKKADIEKQKIKVDELTAKAQTTEIKSEYAGTVSSINVQPGDMTVPEQPLAAIDMASGGYTVKVTVDSDAAAKVTEGSKADVVNDWTGSIEAVLTDIKAETAGDSKSVTLTFDITGDVSTGTYLDLSIPCGSGEYQAIVPKSAVFEDSNGKFVLVVVSKSSPLGNRYFAERVNVEVLASDETSSAVSGGGEISAGKYVITASSKPVAPGDQVRMKD